jgi:DNA-binding MarR family transcriptional regulator
VAPGRHGRCGPGTVSERRYPNVLLQSFITGQLAAELLRRELEPRGMEPRRFGVQSVVGAFGPITPTELATRLGMAPATLSAWIRRLAEDGQLEKKPHPTDGRSYLLELTAAGREAISLAGPGFLAALDRLEAELGSEHEQVWEAGNRFEAALRSTLADSSDQK